MLHAMMKYCEKRKVFSLVLKVGRVEQSIPNVGSKTRESVEVMSLAFALLYLLYFQHAGVRRRAKYMSWSVDM